MAKDSAIEWTDHTFNPWEGCQKVGPGCDHCYAEARNARYNAGTAPNWGPGAPRRRTSAGNWNQPRKWQGDAKRFDQVFNRRQRVFCASLADVFDNAVPTSWRDDLFALIEDCPDLDWLLLTKRIGNVPAMLADLGRDALPDNVWLGATIVNQVEADRDIPKLLAVPARVRFLSMEPLLGPVDLTRLHHDGMVAVNALTGDCGVPEPHAPSGFRGLDWIIVGGETGAKEARPMHPDWARSLRDQCAAAGTPFLFKQWGDWLPFGQTNEHHVNLDKVQKAAVPGEPVPTYRIGKKWAGRKLDGREHNGFPRT